MKRINGVKICYALSVLLLLGFIIQTIIDYNRYYSNSTLTSAPFYLTIIVNTIFFIVPSVVTFIVGLIIKYKSKK